jgi:hypothetical protein
MPTDAIHHAFLIGFADGMVRPTQNITRAETATIFFRLITDEHRANIWSQTNPFADVAMTGWYNNAISTMHNGGLFNGIPMSQSFNPNQPITRAEFAAMVVNYLGLGHYFVRTPAFADTSGHWANSAISVAYMQGWVNGFGDGTFRPDQAITRAEVAALVNRALNRMPENNVLLNGSTTWPDNANQGAWYFWYMQHATNSHSADWTYLVPVRNWTALQLPGSTPWSIGN